tara:strand:- start:339 stop:596 length:258 start_codon:yes stop_codon:yes gene_type:complete
MIVNNYIKAYTNKDEWKRQVKKHFYYNIKSEIKTCAVENVSNVVDYSNYSESHGGPIMNEKGELSDWFPKLYYIRYKTTLRILPA